MKIKMYKYIELYLYIKVDENTWLKNKSNIVT